MPDTSNSSPADRDDANVHADRLPTDEEMARQAGNTRDTFSTGDLVIAPATWGTAVFVVDATHANHDGGIQVGIATRHPDGSIRIDHGIGGAVPATALVRVCRHCLALDPLYHHLLGLACEGPPREYKRVPVTLTDISGGGGEATVHVDTDSVDAMVVVDVAGWDLVGIDLNAGTVGIWVGRDPDNREWAVVDRFTCPAPQVVPGTTAIVSGRTAAPGAAPVGAAEQAFAALTADRRGRLLRRVFEVLEYDEEGRPGGEWSSDTTQALGELFGQFGIVFTSPDETGTDEPDPAVLTWTSADTDRADEQNASSRIRFRVAGVAAFYAVRHAENDRWSTCLVVTDCGREVPEAGSYLGAFDTEADARAAAQRHETSHT